MAVYSASILSPPYVGTGRPIAEIFCSATDSPRIFDITVSGVTNSTGQSVIGLGTPAARGITPNFYTPFLPEDTSQPASSLILVAGWAAPPTVPAVFFRRISMNGASRSLIQFKIPTGIQLGVGSSMVIWNINEINPGPLAVYVQADG